MKLEQLKNVVALTNDEVASVIGGEKTSCSESTAANTAPNGIQYKSDLLLSFSDGSTSQMLRGDSVKQIEADLSASNYGAIYTGPCNPAPKPTAHLWVLPTYRW